MRLAPLPSIALSFLSFFFTVGAPLSPAALPLTPAPAAETVLGQKEVDRFLATRQLSGDGALALRVERIGQSLARVSDRPDLVYTFLVVEGRELQAYSFGGGTVCITEELARLFATDEQLAFAIAHELAHVALRHAVNEGVFEQSLAVGGARSAEAARSLYGQASELEADRYGALYMCRAKYPVTSAVEALGLLEGAGAPASDARHPAYRERIGALERMKTELERSLEAFAHGKEALLAGRADEAVVMLKLFAASFPQSVAGHVNLGSAFLARARSKGTPAGLEEVVPFLPDAGFAVRGAGDETDVERAREHFRRALALRPADPAATLGLALSLLRLADYPGAREELTALAGRSGRSPEVVLTLGNVEFLSGQVARAVELFEEALDLRPGWAAARRNLALACEANGDRAAARNLWEMLATDPVRGEEARRRLEFGR
jgi:predicted Zn-dependent protease